MNAADILNAWAKYSEYDPDQKSFNLLSANYSMHSASKNAAAIHEYDPSGNLAVLYIKEMFRQLCEKSSFRMIDLMQHPESLREHKEMWDMFHSKEVEDIENNILGAMDSIIRKIVPVKQIGERDLDAERSALAESLIGVVVELKKCNVDLFLKSGKIGKISSFSTEIHVFDTLAQCLLTLETAPDSLYVCYIRNKDTSDGYFGFYIKSNGNILSINERVNEPYPGAHRNSRNGRWADRKAYQIFPYSLMKDIGDRDYLGYAHHYTLDDSNLKLFDLGPEGYMPLILAMVMLSVKYSNTSTDQYCVKFVDSLLDHNLKLAQASQETALVIPQNSLVVKANAQYHSTLTTEDVRIGRMNAAFDHTALREAGVQKHYSAVGSFPVKSNIFADLYGDGFVLDTKTLLETNKDHLLIGAGQMIGEPQVGNFEFVGDQDRMDLIAYRAARMQFANYIRDRMFEEYTAFGGVPAAEKWFKQQISLHKEELFRLCASAYTEWLVKPQNFEFGLTAADNGFRMRVVEYKSGVNAYDRDNHPFNNTMVTKNGDRYYTRYACAVESSVKATMEFKIAFSSWTQMAQIFGEENIPKIIKGYESDGHRCTGNTILDCVDYVEAIGTPFETIEYERNARYWSKDTWHYYYWHNHEKYPDWMTKQPPENAPEKSSKHIFTVSISLSKRGLKRIMKDLQKGSGEEK